MNNLTIFLVECVSLIKEKLVNTIEKEKDEVAGFAHYVAMYIVFGKAVSNTKSNLNDAQSNYFIIFHIVIKHRLIFFSNVFRLVR